MPNSEKQKEIRARMLDEQKHLRTELQELKKCQVQYFLASATATGVVLGAISSLSKEQNCLHGFVYLAPLLFVLPCCVTFFDKATSITRVVGYMRWIEDCLADNIPDEYSGYENALAFCRRNERAIVSVIPRVETRAEQFWHFITMLGLRTRNRYWMVNFYTFTGLTIACSTTAIYSSRWGDPMGYWPSTFCIALSLFGVGLLVFPLVSIWHLTVGRYGYDGFRDIWRDVFLYMSGEKELPKEKPSLIRMILWPDLKLADEEAQKAEPEK